jgi:hypothetical protein
MSYQWQRLVVCGIHILVMREVPNPVGSVFPVLKSQMQKKGAKQWAVVAKVDAG